MGSMRIALQMAVAAAAFFGAMPQLAAQQFPWEPAKPVSPPPINSEQPKAPVFKVPKVEPPSRIVPGHNTTRGFVPTYESKGPVHVTPEPGQKSQGWVPGHHDANGAWVPGHPE